MPATKPSSFTSTGLFKAGLHVWSMESTRFLGFGLLMLLGSFTVTQIPVLGIVLGLALEGPLVAGVALATRRVLLGERPEPEDFAGGFSNMRVFLLLASAALISMAIVGLGSLLILPGIFAAAVFWIVVPVLVFEGGNVRTALKRCLELSRPQLFQLIVIRLLFLAVEVLVMIPVLEAMLAGGQPTLSQLMPGLLAAWLLGPFQAILATLAYFKLRGGPEGVLFEG
jgi:hypothetical protein